MDLRSAQIGKEYIVSAIDTDDEELNAFLFSLGCYSASPSPSSQSAEAAIPFPSKTAATTSTASWQPPLSSDP